MLQKYQKKSVQVQDIISGRLRSLQNPAHRAAHTRITMFQWPFAQSTPLELRDRSIEVVAIKIDEMPIKFCEIPYENPLLFQWKTFGIFGIFIKM